MELTVAALLLVIFLFAYSWGRRAGRRQGLAEGAALAGLRLREESLLAGFCVVCRRPPHGRHFIKPLVMQRIGERRSGVTVSLDASRKYGPQRQNMKGEE